MTDLLENIVKSIVNHPNDVFIEEKESVDFPGLTILTINVNEEDKGIIIGRKGRTINSIRDIITISAIRNNKRVRVILKDDNNRQDKRDESQEDMLNDEV